MNWNISNHKIQDILDDLGMLDDNGYCPYTSEELFRTGMEFACDEIVKWLKTNMDLEHDYPNSNEELINDLIKNFGCE